MINYIAKLFIYIIMVQYFIGTIVKDLSYTK